MSTAIFDKAIELKQQLEGLGRGESGGSLVVASGGDVQPAGSLRLLLIAEPGKVSIENLFKIPRSLTFCTDAEIVHNTGRDNNMVSMGRFWKATLVVASGLCACD